jgi:hypothetical protein
MPRDGNKGGARKGAKRGTSAPARERGLPKAQPTKSQRKNAPTNTRREGGFGRQGPGPQVRV